MKPSLLLASLTLSLNAMATQLVSAESSLGADQKIHVSMTTGFSETGFSHPTAVCYIGQSADVCSLIQKTAEAAAWSYAQGNHGTFEVRSCADVNGTVKLAYTAINDYSSDEQLALDISSCN